MMDEYSRVRNMKERYEKISSVKNPGTIHNSCAEKSKTYERDTTKTYGKNYKPSISKTNSSNIIDSTDNFNRPSNIKRTPAFRRDKGPNVTTKENINGSMIHPSSVVSRGVHLFNQGNSIETKSKDITNDSEKFKKPVTPMYAEVRKTLKKVQVDETLNSNGCRPGTITRNEFIQKALQSPLPKGPPPKKPPRTFVSTPSPVDDDSNINICKSKTSPNTKDDKNNEKYSPENSHTIARSKTESEIKLRKIEDVLSKHKMLVGSTTTAQHDSERNFENFKLQRNEFASINSPRRSSIEKIDDQTQQNKMKAEIDPTNITNQLIVKSNQIFNTSPSNLAVTKSVETFKSSPLYEDPSKIHNTNRNDVTSEKDSLYYMSTPVYGITNSTTQDTHTTRVIGCSNSEMISDNTWNDDIDSSIKMLINKAYSVSQTKMSDTSSDSEGSSISLNEQSLNAKKKKINNGEYEQITLKRKGHVRRVASHAVTSLYHNVIPKDSNRLFDCLLLIGLTLDSDYAKVPYIKKKYPKNVNVPQFIEHLCFPDARDWSQHSSCKKEAGKDNFTGDYSYVILLTTATGLRKYAYCKRLKPEGEFQSLPLIYCILSQNKANEFYFRILLEIENRHGESELEFEEFFNDIYNNKFPKNGHGIAISAFSSSDLIGQENVQELICRPTDFRLENLGLAQALALLKFDLFSLIFSSLLLERKVILLSNCTSNLSKCVEGLLMSLMPFEWQHTVITILPPNIISIDDLCEAPTPYLIGLLKSEIPQINNNLEILIIDLDNQTIIRQQGDEKSILPKRLIKGLKNALQLTHASQEKKNNISACEAFMRFFVESIGHYRKFVAYCENDIEQWEHQKDSFVKAAPSKHIRMFLEWFVETISFSVFIENNIGKKRLKYEVFEKRCDEYCNESNFAKNNKSSYIIKNKTMKQYLKDLI